MVGTNGEVKIVAQEIFLEGFRGCVLETCLTYGDDSSGVSLKNCDFRGQKVLSEISLQETDVTHNGRIVKDDISSRTTFNRHIVVYRMLVMRERIGSKSPLTVSVSGEFNIPTPNF